MRLPRLSLATVGFVVLVLAVDFAVIREALVNAENDHPAGYWPSFALFLLPMLDVLLIGLYRLRNRERRTPRAIVFVAAGSVATALVFAGSVLAQAGVSHGLTAVLASVADAIEDGLTRLLGYEATESLAVELTLGIGIEILLPTIFFSLPPLFIALLGGWLTGRLGRGTTTTQTGPSLLREDPAPPLVASSAC